MQVLSRVKAIFSWGCFARPAGSLCKWFQVQRSQSFREMVLPITPSSLTQEMPHRQASGDVSMEPCAGIGAPGPLSICREALGGATSCLLAQGTRAEASNRETPLCVRCPAMPSVADGSQGTFLGRVLKHPMTEQSRITPELTADITCAMASDI